MAAGEIKHPSTEAVSHDEKVDILTFSSEWPNGQRAVRVHFKDRHPAFFAWLYDHGVSPIQLKQREARYVAQGGNAALRVDSGVDMQQRVFSTPNAIGYQ